MPPKRKAAAPTSKLVAHNFLPLLTKPAAVIGDYVSIQGKDFPGCARADKEKWYRCTVRQFDAVHELAGRKTAAFGGQTCHTLSQERGAASAGTKREGGPRGRAWTCD